MHIEPEWWRVVLVISELAQTFISFVELGSLQAVADKRGLTQPAVSHHLKSFEEQFQLKIFTYSGRRKILTQYGQQIFLTLKMKLAELNREIERTNRMYFHPSDVTLRIGLRHEVARKLTPFFNFPGRVIVEATSGQHALELLEKRELDLVITERIANRPDLHSKNIFTDRVQLLVPKSIMTNKPKLEDLRNQDFITQNSFIAYREQPPFLNEFCKGLSLKVEQIHVALICEDWNVVVGGVESGRGWSLVPSGLAINTEQVHVLDVPSKWGPETHFHAYYYAEFLAVPAFKEFLNDFVNAAKDFLK